MKFGLGQTGNPTPQRIAILFDVLASICGIVAGFVTTSAFISHNVSDIISSVLTALIIPILMVLKRFFGADIDNTKSVPIADVKVIDDTKK